MMIIEKTEVRMVKDNFTWEGTAPFTENGYEVKIEVRCMVDEIVEVALPESKADIENYYGIQKSNHTVQQLPELQERVYYMEYDGENWCSSYS